MVRELQLAPLALDNLYVTPTGYPVLVEVKLWKNEESRRKVVVQILEYARLFAGLRYDALNAEIRRLRKTEHWDENPLYEIVKNNVPNPPDEMECVDRVSRSMREGKFLLLIPGDGVREDMASPANYLMHHSLRYAFGIVRIKLFRLPDGAVLAIHDVVAKTQTIERHVTVVTTQGGDLKVSEAGPLTSVVVGPDEKSSIPDRLSGRADGENAARGQGREPGRLHGDRHQRGRSEVGTGPVGQQ